MHDILTVHAARCFFSTSRSYASSVDKNQLSKLRKKTGISFINCKKALEQFNNDLEKAEVWLLEQAQKEGWAKATKLQGRKMSQGLVGMISNPDSATLVEVNCETDFVARNEKFQELVQKVATMSHSFFQKLENVDNILKTDVGSIEQDGKKLSDLIALTVGNIGENMVARRAAHIRKSSSGILGTYVHSSGSPILHGDVRMGKYGVFVEIQHDDTTPIELEEGETLQQLAINISRHIVGFNPRTIGKFEPETENLEDGDEHRNTKSEESNEDCIDKSTEIESRIVEENEYKETENENKENEESENKEKDDNESDNNDDTEEIIEEDKHTDDDRLVYQSYLLNAGIRVGEYMKNCGVSATHFTRFECGEQLSGENDEQ